MWDKLRIFPLFWDLRTLCSVAAAVRDRSPALCDVLILHGWNQ